VGELALASQADLLDDPNRRHIVDAREGDEGPRSVSLPGRADVSPTGRVGDARSG
jgi:hypothetical protein